MFSIMKKIGVVIECFAVAFGITLLILGVLQNVHYLEENRCDMTYMFEYPEYIPVHLDVEIKRNFPKYSLLLYGEGSYADELRSFGPSGIPVLFIPGNAGSHKQVRSLGSVALRKTEQLGFHFNFFAVDFKEEFSALRGSYLWSQTRFVQECIRVILKLYKGSRVDTQSLVLIGHSMGGVIARGLFTLQDFDKKSVNTIITLASPNLRPLLMVDHDMLNFYSLINTLWNSLNYTEHESMMHLVCVSIGGGNRDIQVHSGITPFEDSFLASQSFSVIASAVPKVWLSTDHRCIVWCKQLVLAITRALVEMVHDDKQKIVSSPARRITILKYHLLTAFSMENSMRRVESLLSPDSRVNISFCKLFENKQYYQSSSRLQNKCFLLQVTEDIDEVQVIYTGTSVNWIGACESTTKCRLYLSFATHAEVIPTKDGLEKVISINREVIPIGKRVILLRMNDSKQEKIYVKVSYKTNHTISIRSPLTTKDHNLQLSNQRTFFRLKLPFMRVPWLSYKMSVNTTCKQKAPSISIKLRIPWLKEDILRVFDKSLDLQLKFNIQPPAEYGYHWHRLPVLATVFEFLQYPPSVSMTPSEIMPDALFWFNSKCNFDIRVSLDFLGTVGQLLKFSYVNILKWLAVFSLLNFVVEQPIFLAQRKSQAGFLCILVLHCVSNTPMLCIERFVLVICTILIAYSIYLLLLFSLKLRQHISIFFGYIISYISSLLRTHNKPYNSTTIRSLSVYLFYGELLVFIGCSLCTCGGVGIIVYMLAYICKEGALSPKTPDDSCLIVVQLILQLPNMITWFKELAEGYRIEFDVSSSTCAIFLIGIHFMNHCQENKRANDSFIYKGVNFGFCLLILSPNMDICWIPQVVTLIVLLRCVFYKRNYVDL